MDPGLSLQADIVGIVMVAAIATVIACIVSAIFYAAARRGIMSVKRSINPSIQDGVSRIQDDLKATYADVVSLKTNLPHTAEVTAVQENMKKLCDDFASLSGEIGEQMNSFRLGTADDLAKTKKELISDTAKSLTEKADAHLRENSISREEFEELKERVAKVAGSGDITERLDVLRSLFDSAQIRTLSWQCSLIRLLKGGLAPGAEEDLIQSENIPKSNYKSFLNRLVDNGIAEKKKIPAYYMLPDYEWIYSYVENPDLLQGRIQDSVKKEAEYQQYVKKNLHLVEQGLILESSEYGLETGKIDFMCRDASGKAVGLELKYPSAPMSAKRQILAYRNDYHKKTARTDSRFIVVAPKIPEDVKLGLEADGLEFREIAF